MGRAIPSTSWGLTTRRTVGGAVVVGFRRAEGRPRSHLTVDGMALEEQGAVSLHPRELGSLVAGHEAVLWGATGDPSVKQGRWRQRVQ